MRNLVKTLLMAVLVLGIGLAIWQMTGGDIGGFFNMVGTLLYQAIEAVANFFKNLFGMFASA